MQLGDKITLTPVQIVMMLHEFVSDIFEDISDGVEITERDVFARAQAFVVEKFESKKDKK